jgi:hypothetical protein
MASFIKRVIVAVLSRLPRWAMSPASKIINAIWPGFKGA